MGDNSDRKEEDAQGTREDFSERRDETGLALPAIVKGGGTSREKNHARGEGKEYIVKVKETAKCGYVS